MELPLFNDNLKSSGSWHQALARAQAAWEDTRNAAAVQDEQVKQLAQRAGLNDDPQAITGGCLKNCLMPPSSRCVPQPRRE